jgi:hypothetical protein
MDSAKRFFTSPVSLTPVTSCIKGVIDTRQYISPTSPVSMTPAMHALPVSLTQLMHQFDLRQFANAFKGTINKKSRQ